MDYEATEEDAKAGQELVDTLYLRLHIPERDGRELALLGLVKELFLTLRKKEILSDAEIQNIIDQTRETDKKFWESGVIGKDKDKDEDEGITKEALSKADAAGAQLFDNFTKKVLS